MASMEIYNSVREVPAEAKKTIGAGRLKGFTDINPMWRIKKLTEQFGPCGIGWYTEITNQWLQPGANEEVKAFVNINLFIWTGDKWSAPIQGNGGASFISSEKNGLYTSDECFKMAETDAIGSACKKLGFGADVYWDKDRTKYDKPEATVEEPTKAANKIELHNGAPSTRVEREKTIANIRSLQQATGVTEEQILYKFNENRDEDIKYTCLGEFRDTDLFAAEKLLMRQKATMDKKGA